MKRQDLAGKQVAALVSGGLDSTTFIHWLSKAGVRVLAITADLGQPDEKGMDDILRRMKAAGAEEAISVDARELLAKYMMMLIQGIAHHEGGYMNTTGIARMATIAAVLPELEKRNIKVMIHGATGRGNDQVRFELGPAMLAPEIEVYAPWRDPEFIEEFGGRKEMIEYCQVAGLEVSATLDKPYSTDSNFCGLTHEAGMLEDLMTSGNIVKFLMGKSHEEAGSGCQVTIEFANGQLVAVNGKQLPLLDGMLYLNQIAGPEGIGIGIDVVENRRVGIKSRGVYESPGVTLLEAAYAKMLELILDRNRRKFFEIVSRQLADAIYEGEFFGPLASDLLAVTSNVAKLVTGKLSFWIYKGNITFIGAENVIHSLYDADIASMENIGSFNHADSQGYLRIAGVTARTMAAAGQIIPIG